MWKKILRSLCMFMKRMCNIFRSINEIFSFEVECRFLFFIIFIVVYGNSIWM